MQSLTLIWMFTCNNEALNIGQPAGTYEKATSFDFEETLEKYL